MNSLVKLFCDLVSIPSPVGKEREVGEFVLEYLAKRNVIGVVDKTGKINDSNFGNIVVKLDGNPDYPTLLFVAHLDTVEKGEKIIKPRISKGIITSDKTTVLGVDDKAAVACLLEVLATTSTQEDHPTIIFAFTTREEEGIMGSSLLQIKDQIDYCFNLDGPNPVGTFVYQTLGEQAFKIVVKGKAAHSAVEPEKGINALSAAATSITKFSLGKNKKGNVFNIGKIYGGRGNNIIPDEITMEGQVRAYTKKELDGLIQKIETILEEVCHKTGCSYELTFPSDFVIPPGEMSKDAKIVSIAKKATKCLGLPFALVKGSYTSDANFLAQKYVTLELGVGGKMPHSFDESIAIADLVKSKELILAIIKEVTKEKN